MQPILLAFLLLIFKLFKEDDISCPPIITTEIFCLKVARNYLIGTGAIINYLIIADDNMVNSIDNY